MNSHPAESQSEAQPLAIIVGELIFTQHTHTCRKVLLKLSVNKIVFLLSLGRDAAFHTHRIRYRREVCSWSIIIGVLNNSVSKIALLSFASMWVMLLYTGNSWKNKTLVVRNLLIPVHPAIIWSFWPCINESFSATTSSDPFIMSLPPHTHVIPSLPSNHDFYLPWSLYLSILHL